MHDLKEKTNLLIEKELIKRIGAFSLKDRRIIIEELSDEAHESQGKADQIIRRLNPEIGFSKDYLCEYMVMSEQNRQAQAQWRRRTKPFKRLADLVFLLPPKRRDAVFKKLLQKKLSERAHDKISAILLSIRSGQKERH